MTKIDDILVLGRAQRSILQSFIQSELCVYDVWKAEGKRRAYRNVHKQVTGLRKRGLIRQTRIGKEHGSKYYRLTDLGNTYVGAIRQLEHILK